jgi:hypothetical protein
MTNMPSMRSPKMPDKLMLARNSWALMRLLGNMDN